MAEELDVNYPDQLVLTLYDDTDEIRYVWKLISIQLAFKVVCLAKPIILKKPSEIKVIIRTQI